MVLPFPPEEISQVTAALPAYKRTSTDQPMGNRPTKAIDAKLQREICSECAKAFSQGLISEDARRFLEGWAHQQLPKRPRPSSYNFLVHNWQKEPEQREPRKFVPYDGLSLAVNHVRIMQGPARERARVDQAVLQGDVEDDDLQGGGDLREL